MKFLFDFDGVLTNQTEEALRVRELFLDEMVQTGGSQAGPAAQLFAQGEQAMDREPHRHGWRHHGRVTAFANEDLFIRNNGLAACLDDWAGAGEPVLLEVLGRIRDRGIPSFQALANRAYDRMLEETRAGVLKPIDPFSKDLMEGLLGRGHDVVVVSNSSTDRIIHLLGSVGLKACAHAEEPNARLRVRGDARKFELGAESRVSPVGEYAVEVSRPYYERILREEVPGAVIGDVFSLDLALPLYLARTESARFGGLRAYLRTRPYTPAWSREHVLCSAPDGKASLHLLPELSLLLE